MNRRHLLGMAISGLGLSFSTPKLVTGGIEDWIEAVHSGYRVGAVAFSPEGARLATGSDDRIVSVWDLDARQEILAIADHDGPIRALAFSPDGTRIISASPGLSARPVPLPGMGMGGISGRGMGGMGKNLGQHVRSHDLIKEWDADSGRAIRTYKGASQQVLGMAYNADGSEIVAVDSTLTVRAWKTADGSETFLLEGPGLRGLGGSSATSKVSFSVDARRIASLNWVNRDFDNPEQTSNGLLRLWDLDTEDHRLLDGQSVSLWAAALSPDGSQVVASSHTHILKAWNFDSEDRLFGRAPMNEPQGAHFLAFSPDGNRFVSGTEEGVIRLWNGETGNLLQTVQGPRGFVRAVAFLPDRLRIASGGWYGLGGLTIPGTNRRKHEPVKVWEAELRPRPE